jgi:hypothetical protein
MGTKVGKAKRNDPGLKSRISNKSKILAALTKAGPAGVTNAQLSEIQLRYGVSIHVLAKEGHIITNTLIKGGLRRYVLAPETPCVESQPASEEAA